MTRDEIVQKLTKELEEELEGILEYNELYNSLVALGCKDEADRIERIASEEYYHAKILQDILWMMNVDVSHHIIINNHWQKVKKIFAIE